MKLRFVCTCGACPEQYDIWDDDQNIMVAYVRYRCGTLTVNPYNPEVYKRKNYFGDEVDDQEIDWSTVILSESIGDGLDGCFDDNEREGILKRIEEAVLKFYQDKEK